jgi:hypothetical protein
MLIEVRCFSTAQKLRNPLSGAAVCIDIINISTKTYDSEPVNPLLISPNTFKTYSPFVSVS